jgi:hypothetical protein
MDRGLDPSPTDVIADRKLLGPYRQEAVDSCDQLLEDAQNTI